MSVPFTEDVGEAFAIMSFWLGCFSLFPEVDVIDDMYDITNIALLLYCHCIVCLLATVALCGLCAS